MFRRAFTLALSLDCMSQFRSPRRKCSTFSESNLPNNVFTCAKSSWGEFGGLYHEVKAERPPPPFFSVGTYEFLEILYSKSLNKKDKIIFPSENQIRNAANSSNVPNEFATENTTKMKSKRKNSKLQLFVFHPKTDN